MPNLKEEVKQRYKKLKEISKTKTYSKGKKPKANVQGGINALLRTI